jgi:O-acetyl-ADP-ribose deacetylase (regulator of RNase III)
MPTGLRVELVKGDITELEVDAIVNAANRYLKHGGGVAGAIIRKGGAQIQRESDEYVRKHGPLKVGGVAVTKAGRLKAKFVIHAVGPKWGDPDGDERLAEAIRNSLLKAEELGLSSMAMPAISTGIYGYPLDVCARVMARELKDFLRLADKLKKVIVCLYDDEAFKTFRRVFEEEKLYNK